MVVVVVGVTKFVHGAWIVLILIPMIVSVCLRINKHYRKVAQALTLDKALPAAPQKTLVLVLAGGLHRGLLAVLQYAQSISTNVRAIHVEIEGHEDPRILRNWASYVPNLQLIVLDSPYRELAQPVRDYIRKVRDEEKYDFVLVVVPEFVVETWWESLLHNHSALFLQWALADEKGALVVVFRYRLADLIEDEPAAEPPRPWAAHNVPEEREEG